MDLTTLVREIETSARFGRNSPLRTKWKRSATLCLSGMGIAILAVAVVAVSGCGSNGSSSASGFVQPGLATPPPASPINSYFGTTGDIWVTKINHTLNQVNGEDTTAHGKALAYSIIGTFNTLDGFLDISLTKVSPELTGQTTGFALDIPGRAALLRYGDTSEPLIPLAPTNACTVINGTVTYNYVTIPGATTAAGSPSWNPMTDSTYGTFQVQVSGSTWNIFNITQFTLSGGMPANPGTGLPAGFCGIGTTGYAVTAASNALNPPVATTTMGFGPSGFFLEDNGSAQATPVGVVPSNAIGAGVGAIGVLQPSTTINTSTVVSSSFLGFYYEPGVTGGAPVTQLASFGCSGSNCPSPPSPTAIVGGVFPNDDLTQPPTENVVIDLGSQNSGNNGLYSSASISVSGVIFPAAGVVGTLENQYAILLIAQDTINNVPLVIYLFQQ